jgi:hypothetical protein
LTQIEGICVRKKTLLTIPPKRDIHHPINTLKEKLQIAVQGKMIVCLWVARGRSHPFVVRA